MKWIRTGISVNLRICGEERSVLIITCTTVMPKHSGLGHACLSLRLLRGQLRCTRCRGSPMWGGSAGWLHLPSQREFSWRFELPVTGTVRDANSHHIPSRQSGERECVEIHIQISVQQRDSSTYAGVRPLEGQIQSLNLPRGSGAQTFCNLCERWKWILWDWGVEGAKKKGQFF